MDVLQYVIMAVIIGMIASVWAMLGSIGQDNNRMLHVITDALQKTGNSTKQAHGVAEIHSNNELLHEILGNLTKH